MEARAAKMTWGELQSRVKKIGVAIIPVGAIERHGNHLPMENDAALAFEVACRVGTRTGAVVFPTLTYGILEASVFQGVYLSGNTYSCLVKEVCLGVESLGFRKILFISAHHPNNPFILHVLKELFEEKPKERILSFAHCGSLAAQLLPDLVKSEHGGHAGFRETSVMMAIDEKIVDLSKVSQPAKIAKKFSGGLESADVQVVNFGKAKVTLFHKIDSLKNSAGWGKVEGASEEYGREILSTLSDYLSLFVEELRKIKLPLG